MTQYKIVAQRAMEGTETVWAPVETVKFESDATPDEIAAAVRLMAAVSEPEEPATGRHAIR